MDKDASFLFAGTTFNRKKFGADLARFQAKKESQDSESFDYLNLLQSDKTEPEEPNASTKKRKRKDKYASVMVEGFDVFKASKPSVSAGNEKKGGARDEDEKKELNRQIERDALLRKKHNIHVAGSNVPSPLHSFRDLSSSYKCDSFLLSNLAELGFKEPTPIQRQAIPVLLSGRECFACAPTGSGKTFSFVCPMLMKLKRPSKDGIRAVILSPTRELAAQTARESKRMAKGSKFRVRVMTKQLLKSVDFSKRSCDILITTPLRLQLAIKKKKIDLSRVEYLVLDESDKLFEPDLLKQIDSVVKACTNPSIVRSLFSATLPDFVEELARTIMHDAVRVIVGRKNTASETIKQELVYVLSEEGKLMALRQNFAKSLNPPVLIFVQSKERAKQLYEELKFDNIRVAAIHSDLFQAERENAVDDFRAGKTWVLIATDVIARGMDFKGVNCVINYDFPDSGSAYIHRIGRTGRAGRPGEAITYYTEADIPYIRSIANVMAASGCEVPAYLTNLPTKKWKKHRPKRDAISTKPRDDEESQD